MSSYLYAAQIGDFIKVGYTTNPDVRAKALCGDYLCEVTLLGIVKGRRLDEAGFHTKNRRYAVAPEVYVADAPPVVEFVGRLSPFKVCARQGRSTSTNWPPLPPGQIPVSRYRRQLADRAANAREAAE